MVAHEVPIGKPPSSYNTSRDAPATSPHNDTSSGGAGTSTSTHSADLVEPQQSASRAADSADNNHNVKHVLLAFDEVYNVDGTVNRELTGE